MHGFQFCIPKHLYRIQSQPHKEFSNHTQKIQTNKQQTDYKK